MSSSQPPCAGIVYSDGKSWLPLIHLDVHVSIVDTSSRVILSQTYFYDGPHILTDAYYMFPLLPNAAVCGFEMKTNDGTSIEGVVKKISDARQDYEDAVRDGKLASLLEQFHHDRSFFPQTEIQISTSFVMDLSDNEEDDSVRFQLPAYVSHRYGVPPTSKLYYLTGTSHSAGLSINLDIQMSGEILDVRSNYSLEDIPVVPDGTSHLVRKQFKSPGQVFLHDDFLLIIQAIGLDEPRCFVETWGRTAALSLSLVPQFNSAHLSIPPSEYVFLIDHSGSMWWDNNKLSQAKQALDILLRSLPQGSDTWFNIFQFDDSCQGLWTQSRRFDGMTLLEGLFFSSNIPNGGGTDILNAIRTAFQSRRTNVPTSVFVLTDGEDGNTDLCISTVRTAVQTAPPGAPIRVFSLALGHSASMALCEGIASAGKGFCSSALEGDQLMKKCVTLLNGMMSNDIRNLRIDWGVDGNIHIQQTPHNVNLFSKKRLAVSMIIPKDQVPSIITISGTFPDGTPLSHHVIVEQVQTNHLLPLIDPRLKKLYRRPLLHTLTAHRLILDLERGISPQDIIFNWTTLPPSSRIKAVEDKIVSLGVKYHLASSQTAFVAVDTPPAPPAPAPAPPAPLTTPPTPAPPAPAPAPAPPAPEPPAPAPPAPAPAPPAPAPPVPPAPPAPAPAPPSPPPPMPGEFPPYIFETHLDTTPDVLYFFGGNVPDAVFIAPPSQLTKIFSMPVKKITSWVSRGLSSLGPRVNWATGGMAKNIWDRLFPANQSAAFDAKLTELAAFQGSDGSFSNIRGLCNTIGCSPYIPSHVVFPDSVTSQEAVWATALAIAYLRERFPQNWLTWKDLVRKSMVWGQATCGSLMAFEAIMTQARSLF